MRLQCCNHQYIASGSLPATLLPWQSCCLWVRLERKPRQKLLVTVQVEGLWALHCLCNRWAIPAENGMLLAVLVRERNKVKASIRPVTLSPASAEEMRRGPCPCWVLSSFALETRQLESDLINQTPAAQKYSSTSRNYATSVYGCSRHQRIRWQDNGEIKCALCIYTIANKA